MTAIEYLKDHGCGTGTNFTVKQVAELMEDFHKLKTKEIADFTESDKAAWRPSENALSKDQSEQR